ncbi:Protein tilB [Diplonema papillatum]|nr:Protein tilB [Diplonema papillatum]
MTSSKRRRNSKEKARLSQAEELAAGWPDRLRALVHDSSFFEWPERLATPPAARGALPRNRAAGGPPPPTVTAAFWESVQKLTGFSAGQLAALVGEKAHDTYVVPEADDACLAKYDPDTLLRLAKGMSHAAPMEKAVQELRRRIETCPAYAIRGADLIRVASEQDFENGIRTSKPAGVVADSETQQQLLRLKQALQAEVHCGGARAPKTGGAAADSGAAASPPPPAAAQAQAAQSWTTPDVVGRVRGSVERYMATLQALRASMGERQKYAHGLHDYNENKKHAILRRSEHSARKSASPAAIRAAVETLTLHKRGIREMDDDLRTAFPNLRVLSLTGNAIKTLRNCPASLSALQAHSNCIEACDPETGLSPSLVHAGLSHNRLNNASLASFVAFAQTHAVGLVSLDVSRNEISSFRAVVRLVASCPKLRSLRLAGNPLALLPWYRQAVLAGNPGLDELDDEPITTAQRDHAAETMRGIAAQRQAQEELRGVAAHPEGSGGGGGGGGGSTPEPSKTSDGAGPGPGSHRDTRASEPCAPCTPCALPPGEESDAAADRFTVALSVHSVKGLLPFDAWDVPAAAPPADVRPPAKGKAKPDKAAKSAAAPADEAPEAKEAVFYLRSPGGALLTVEKRQSNAADLAEGEPDTAPAAPAVVLMDGVAEELSGGEALLPFTSKGCDRGGPKEEFPSPKADGGGRVGGVIAVEHVSTFELRPSAGVTRLLSTAYPIEARQVRDGEDSLLGVFLIDLSPLLTTHALHPYSPPVPGVGGSFSATAELAHNGAYQYQKRRAFEKSALAGVSAAAALCAAAVAAALPGLEPPPSPPPGSVARKLPPVVPADHAVAKPPPPVFLSFTVSLNPPPRPPTPVAVTPTPADKKGKK